jgi:hypothetical protein
MVGLGRAELATAEPKRMMPAQSRTRGAGADHRIGQVSSLPAAYRYT